MLEHLLIPKSDDKGQDPLNTQPIWEFSTSNAQFQLSARVASNYVNLVNKHNRRAIKRGLPGTLTIQQWEQRVNETNDRCTFCGGPNESIEHVKPLHWGEAGNTYANCVPCCIRCNELRNYVGQAVLVWDSPIVADLVYAYA